MPETAFSMDDRIVATKRQVSCTVAREVVILHLDDGAYYGLDEVGARIWQLVQEPRTVGELVRGIVAEFDVENEECARDVRELLVELAHRGLIEQETR